MALGNFNMTFDKQYYINALKKRHSHLVFGYNGTVYDHQLIGYIVTEATLLSPNSIHVKKQSDIWYVVSEHDWINEICDDESYLFTEKYFGDPDDFYHLSGVVLSAFSNGVGLALDGKITISHHISERELEAIQPEIDQLSGRTVFFKSVENLQ
jgi:hypothetical protein